MRGIIGLMLLAASSPGVAQERAEEVVLDQREIAEATAQAQRSLQS